MRGCQSPYVLTEPSALSAASSSPRSTRILTAQAVAAAWKPSARTSRALAMASLASRSAASRLPSW